jgi:hypothetical protein
MKQSLVRVFATVSVVAIALLCRATAHAQPQLVNWRHLSSATGELPVPPVNDGQSGMRVVDLDGDGQTDYLITLWKAQGIVWYRQTGGTFERYVIEPDNLMLSHGERFADIDRDGDIDLIFGQASTGNDIYWWENPYPAYSPSTRWVRRTVRNAGANMYHDNIWGDFDGDGVDEFVSWNQHAKQLLMFEVPANPRTSGQWPATPIYSWADRPEVEYRGIAATDVNLDGLLDFVGGGGWFEYTGGEFIFHEVDPLMSSGRMVAGQIIPGGRPEFVAVQELADGPLRMYEWTGLAWQTRTIIPAVARSHTLELGDINRDGCLDVLFGEMGMATRPPVENPDPLTLILYGDCTGNFRQQTVFVGQGTLEGKLGDIDDDGDLDIIGNTFRHNAPRFDMWINDGYAPVVHPAAGSYSGHAIVSLSSEAEGTIRYTLDGSAPTTTSSTYVGPFVVNRTVTVKAIVVKNGAPLPGVTTAVYEVTPDTIRPSVVSAYGVTSPARITVRFSEPVARASAELPANYTVSGGVAVTSATLDGSLRTVTLETSGLVETTTYTLAVSNVSDLSVAANRVAAGSAREFRAYHLPPASLALWLRADAGTVLNGSAVPTWNDGSGHNRHATQLLHVFQPVLRDAAVNGLPALRFDGVNDFQTLLLPVNGLTGMSVFLVTANRSNQTGGASRGDNAALFWNSSGAWGAVYLSPFQSSVNLRFGTGQTSNNLLYARPATIGAAFTMTASIKSGTVDSLFVGGELVLRQTGRLSTIALTRDVANVARGANDGTFFAGDIAEVIVYTRALSTQERLSVERYLAEKYGLAGGTPSPATGTVTTSVVGSGTVTKSPNEASYAVGTQVQLTAVPVAGWTFTGWSGAFSGTANPVTLTVTGNHSVTATFVKTSSPPASGGAVISDDFSGTSLNTSLWTIVNPIGDATAAVSGGAVRLHLPAGVDHDVWTSGNRAIRLMQPVADADFEVEVKFDSVVGPKYQMQGILVEQEPGTFLRFNVQGDGTSARFFAASFMGGTPTTRLNKTLAAGPRYYLRVAREGTLWRFRYSYDGTIWTTIGTFTQTLTVREVGVFAGNAQGATSPAFTAVVDYFFNTAAPIAPED